jgi:hypothetical protein
LAKVGYPTFGVKRCVSGATPKVESDIKTSVSATEQNWRNRSFKRKFSPQKMERPRPRGQAAPQDLPARTRALRLIFIVSGRHNAT